MKQFQRILRFEMRHYFTNRAFVGVTLFLVVTIAVVMFFPRILEAADSGESGPVDRPVMLLAGDPSSVTPGLDEAFAAAFGEYEVRRFDGDAEAIQAAVTAKEGECGIYLHSLREYTYFVNNRMLADHNAAVADEVLRQLAARQFLIEQGLDMAAVQAAQTVAVTHEEVTLGVDQAHNYFYTYIMIFALYMVIMLYGQMVATNVASEKSSRAMEVLITSAKPTAMMFGKVIASGLAGLTQLVVIFGSAVLCFNLNRGYWSDLAIVVSIFDMPLALLGYMLVFFVLGFFLYAFMYGAIGSTVSKLEDVGTAVMPVTMMFVVAFVVVMTALSGSMDSPLIKVFSFIPFTSPMAMFTRIAMSAVPWYEIAVSAGLLAATVIGIGVLAAKIYRVGVLLYGNRPKIWALLKAIRKA